MSSLYSEELVFISEDEKIDNSEFKLVDGQIYLSFDFIRDYIDEKIVFDEASNTVIITTDEVVKRLPLDSYSGSLNETVLDLRAQLFSQDGKVYLPIESFIYDYPVDLKYLKDNGLIVMDRKNMEYLKAKVTVNEAKLRESADSKAPYVKSLEEGAELIVYSETEKWYKVREVEGYAGYIKKSDVEVDQRLNAFSKEIELADKSLKKKINLTWDYTYGPLQNADTVTNLPGVNVVSPTWFTIADGSGSIEDRGNSEYVRAYQSQGKEVWGMVDNTLSSSAPEITSGFINSAETREKVINELLKKFKYYGMDGINIDFENTKVEDREAITQFMRELYPVFKSNDMKVSIAVTPRIYNEVEKEQFDRAALAETSDYVILMAYDQHWASSQEAGSVAEHRWVENNLNVLFRQIPMDKFILGVPLYTRVWNERDGKVTSQSVGMQVANDYIHSNNFDMEWDPLAKQYVGHKEMDGALNSIWMENAESLKHKVALVGKYDLAGVASWRRGFETQDVWNVIADTLNY